MKKLLLSALVLSAGVASAQWEVQNTGFAAEARGVNEIDIVDENIVWALAYDGTAPTNDIFEYTMTTDGGATWTAGFIDTADAPINNIDGVNATDAWVSSIATGEGGHLYHLTEASGGIWEEANPFVIGQTTPSFTYDLSFQNGVHFFDAMNGIVYGDPVEAPSGPALDFEIYWTENGGIIWTRVNPASLTNANSDGGEYGYNGGNVGAGDYFWMVTSVGNIYRSADKGHTWVKKPSPIEDFGGVETPNTNGTLHMSNTGTSITTATGILLGTTDGGQTYTRYETTDGGDTWSAGVPYTAGYFNMDFIPGTSVLVATGDNVDNEDSSAYSLDLGATWNEIDSGTQRTTVAFLDGDTGWAGGFNDDDTTGGIFKYTGEALRVPTVANKPQFSATPNPTNGMLQVANDNANITDVVVYDLLGKQVYAGKFSALNQVDLDLTPLTAGAYILTATADNGAKQTIKIMKN
jgi:photosystem II stability/assembly factor-like uncharacterized protein